MSNSHTNYSISQIFLKLKYLNNSLKTSHLANQSIFASKVAIYYLFYSNILKINKIIKLDPYQSKLSEKYAFPN